MSPVTATSCEAIADAFEAYARLHVASLRAEAARLRTDGDEWIPVDQTVDAITKQFQQQQSLKRLQCTHHQ